VEQLTHIASFTNRWQNILWLKALQVQKVISRKRCALNKQRRY